MATKKEIKKHLKKALQEIGPIVPYFDDEVNEWVFKHPHYPVEYGGQSPEEVVQNYPLYLHEFIAERLKNNLDPLVEKKTKGLGGYRPGSGRPKGSHKESKKRIYVPIDLIDWLRSPENIEKVRDLKDNARKK